MRAHYARDNIAPVSLVEAGITDAERTGEYYVVGNVIEIDDQGRAVITCTPNPDTGHDHSDDGVGRMIFDWNTGNSEIIWED